MKFITAIILATAAVTAQAETRVANKPHSNPMFLVNKSVSQLGNPVGIFRVQWKDGTSSFTMFEAKCNTFTGRVVATGEGSASNMKSSIPAPNSDPQGFYRLVGAGGQGSFDYNRYQSLCGS
jgi:hypothetical protein